MDPLPDPQAFQEAKAAGQAANKASLVHELDLFCRTEISHAMQKLTSDKVRQGLLHDNSSESTLHRNSWYVSCHAK